MNVRLRTAPTEVRDLRLVHEVPLDARAVAATEGNGAFARNPERDPGGSEELSQQNCRDDPDGLFERHRGAPCARASVVPFPPPKTSSGPWRPGSRWVGRGQAAASGPMPPAPLPRRSAAARRWPSIPSVALCRIAAGATAATPSRVSR